jgi:hypothetical protein
MGLTYPFFACSDIPRVTHPLLASASEKVRWAEKHLEALQASIWSYFGEPGNAPLLRCDLDPQTGYHIFSIKSLPDYTVFQADVALAIGDVIGNVRAALDHAMWALTTDGVTGVHPDLKGIAYPIRDDATQLSGSRVERAVKPYVDSLVWDVVLLGLLDQTYPGAKGVYGSWGIWQSGHDHPLRLLQDLSNDDKHRLLPTLFLLPTSVSMIPLGPFATVRHPIFGDIPDMPHLPYGEPIALNMPVHVVRFLNVPEPHIDDAGQVTPQVAFQDRSIVIGTLDRITCFVKFLLCEFERVLPAVS